MALTTTRSRGELLGIVWLASVGPDVLFRGGRDAVGTLREVGAENLEDAPPADPGWATAVRQHWRSVPVALSSPGRLVESGGLSGLRIVSLSQLLVVLVMSGILAWITAGFAGTPESPTALVFAVAVGLAAVVMLVGWRPSLAVAEHGHVRDLYFQVMVLRLVIANAAVVASQGFAVFYGDLRGLVAGLGFWLVSFVLAAPTRIRLRLDQQRADFDLVVALSQ